jgi:hypothetical protein
MFQDAGDANQTKHCVVEWLFFLLCIQEIREFVSCTENWQS